MKKQKYWISSEQMSGLLRLVKEQQYISTGYLLDGFGYL